MAEILGILALTLFSLLQYQKLLLQTEWFPIFFCPDFLLLKMHYPLCFIKRERDDFASCGGSVQISLQSLAKGYTPGAISGTNFMSGFEWGSTMRLSGLSDI